MSITLVFPEIKYMALNFGYFFLSLYIESTLKIPLFMTSVKVKKLLINIEPLVSNIKTHFPNISKFCKVSCKSFNPNKSFVFFNKQLFGNLLSTIN